MNSQPLVSIVTPFFNAEKYFQETIESVIAQTYDNWELLLVDDGSSDGSTAIAQKYAQQYPEKIRYLAHDRRQNRGKSISRNLGINSARGKYLALLDSDDVYLPEKLEKQVAILESQPDTVMVYGPTLYWYGWTGNPKDIRRDYQPKLGVEPNTLFSSPNLLTLFLKNPGMLPCTCGLLAKRQVVVETGGFEESIQNMYEDQVFMTKICLAGAVFVEGGCWDKYRQHLESSSYVAIKSGEYHPSLPNPARLTFLNWLGEYLKAHNVKEADFWKVHQQALWPYLHPHLSQVLFPTRYWLKQVTGRLFYLMRRTFLLAKAKDINQRL